MYRHNRSHYSHFGMSDDQRENAARQRVHAIRSLFGNLVCFLKVTTILFVIDLVTGGGWWFYKIAFFFGIVLALKTMQAFDPSRMMDEAWEERKIQELMERENGQKSKPKFKNDQASGTADDYFEDDETVIL